MQGYANTRALAAYNESDRATGDNSGYTVLPLTLIKSYGEVHLKKRGSPKLPDGDAYIGLVHS